MIACAIADHEKVHSTPGHLHCNNKFEHLVEEYQNMERCYENIRLVKIRKAGFEAKNNASKKNVVVQKDQDNEFFVASLEYQNHIKCT